MNEVVNKFLSAGDNFMPEMHLKQPEFIHSAFGAFTKNKERIQKFQETGDSRYIYKNELDKACIQKDLAYGCFKDLARRTESAKVLRAKTFNIAKNPKYDGYQRRLSSMIYKLFDEKTSGGANKSITNQKLAINFINQLFNFFLKSVYSSFKDNIWGAVLADMQLISKSKKRIRFLLCIIGLFSKYACVVHLKEKTVITIVNAFQKVLNKLNKSYRKPNQLWIDKGSELYNNSFKK